MFNWKCLEIGLILTLFKKMYWFTRRQDLSIGKLFYFTITWHRPQILEQIEKHKITNHNLQIAILYPVFSPKFATLAQIRDFSYTNHFAWGPSWAFRTNRKTQITISNKRKYNSFLFWRILKESCRRWDRSFRSLMWLLRNKKLTYVSLCDLGIPNLVYLTN